QSTGFSRQAPPAEGTPAEAGTLNDTRLWVAAERLPQFSAIFPDAWTEPPIIAPAALAETIWSSESALVEIIRGRLEGLGPVTAQALADSLGLKLASIGEARVNLAAEGFVFRARFTARLAMT